MKKDHIAALMEAADASAGRDGWVQGPDGRHFTFHLSANGAAVTLGRVEAFKVKDDLLHARTAKGECYLTALENVFAASVEGAVKEARKAGFV